MNKDILQGKWEQVKGTIQKNWGEITNDDLTQIEGDLTKLKGILQEKYGYSREESERMYSELFNDIDIDDPYLFRRDGVIEDDYVYTDDSVHRRRDDFIETEDELLHDEVVRDRYDERYDENYVEDDRGILEKIGDFLTGKAPEDRRHDEMDINRTAPLSDERHVVDTEDYHEMEGELHPEFVEDDELGRYDREVRSRMHDDIGYYDVDPGLDPDLETDPGVVTGSRRVDDIDPVKLREEELEELDFEKLGEEDRYADKDGLILDEDSPEVRRDMYDVEHDPEVLLDEEDIDLIKRDKFNK